MSDPDAIRSKAVRAGLAALAAAMPTAAADCGTAGPQAGQAQLTAQVNAVTFKARDTILTTFTLLDFRALLTSLYRTSRKKAVARCRALGRGHGSFFAFF